MPPFDWHDGKLSCDTRLDHAFAKTQNVRRFMMGICGQDFRFDREMIEFIENESPETLGEIADHWLARPVRRRASAP